MGTDLITQYRRERRRVLAQRRSLQKRGFDTSDIKIPKIPKKITEGSVRRLQKMTTRSIQEKATKTDVDTGEIITARQETVRGYRRRGKRKTIKPIVSRPTKTETAEATISEYELLSARLYEKIEEMPNYMIPQFSKGCSAICKSALDDFMRKTNDTEEACQALRNALQDKIINATYFDSDQIFMARQWAMEMDRLADYLQSETLKEAANIASDMEEAGEDYYELDDETLEQMQWMFE